MRAGSPSSCKGKQFSISAAYGADCIATANWLLDHGAKVKIVGVQDASDVERRIRDHIKRCARDGDDYEKLSKRISVASDPTEPVSDMRALFLSAWKRKVIGITGRYGKTTTAVWAAHLIGDAVIAGHMPGKPLLPALDSRARTAVIVLDAAPPSGSRIAVVSTDAMSNLDAAIAAAKLAGVPEAQVKQRVATLPQVPLRQEVVHRSAKLTVVNDAMSTKPAHGIAALHRWGGPTCILICGGSGGSEDYGPWACEVPKHIRRTNLIFLSGDATNKMRSALGSAGRGIRAYDSLERAFKTAYARAGLYVSSVILFSPATPSGVLFADEVRRGQALNALVERFCQGRAA